MKITLDSSIKEHREVLGLVDSEDLSIIKRKGKFAFYVIDESTEKGFVIKDKITIDLDQAKMDLRMAIGTNIDFIVICHESEESGCVEIGVIESLDYCGEIIINGERLAPDEVKLCPDYLKSVGVEVEE